MNNKQLFEQMQDLKREFAMRSLEAAHRYHDFLEEEEERQIEGITYPKVAQHRPYALAGYRSILQDYIRWDEDRFGDEFNLPLEYFYDPEAWEKNYRKETKEFEAAALAQREIDQAAAAERKEKYEREKLAELQEKYGAV